jgi:FtsP/CotA-like multicopper oxidase with cupredoxin domain
MEWAHTTRGEAMDLPGLMRSLLGIFLLWSVAWPSSGPVASPLPPSAGCGPAPAVLANPPEMKRVDGRVQSIELEARQDGERLCFVDRNNADRPGVAPTIRVRPGEILRVRLFNRITDPSVLRKTTPPGHATKFPGVSPTPGYFEVLPGAYHEPTGNTNLHFHGLEVRSVPCGPGVAPGDDVVRTFFVPETQALSSGACESAYEIAIPDDHPAGLYWYHTHFHGESDAQTLLGLSGAIVIENADDDARRRDGMRERILIVRDRPAPEAKLPGTPKPANPSGSQPQSVIAGPPRGATAARNGAQLPQCAFGKCINTAAEVQCSSPAEREQTTILSINGISIRDSRNPDGSVPEIKIDAGRKEFWRVLNAAADTYVRLHFADLDAAGSVPIEVVALDGFPFADETHTDAIMVPPAGRVEFYVKLDLPVARHRIILRSEAVETGCAGDLMPARDLAAIKVDPDASGSPISPAPMQPPKTPQNAMPAAGTAARQRTFAFTEFQRPKSSKTDFYITEISRPDAVIEPYPMHGAPSSVVEVEANSVEEWTILNFTHELHNFHIHQLHFRVLESEDKFVEGRMLDTINVPIALPDANWSAETVVTPGKVRLLMRFHQNIAGEFVFHCHILSHEDKGMMGLIRVVAASHGEQLPPSPHPLQHHR